MPRLVPRRSLVLTPLLVVAPPLVGRAAAQAPGPPAFLVIVHPDNPATRLERRFLREAFLKKALRWPSGPVIRPVDLDQRAPVRRRFSEDVLQRSVAAVKSYWQQLIFSGRGVPPPELDSSAATVEYVLRYPEAVGYVASDTALATARAVTLA